jgi:hypothetical protein
MCAASVFVFLMPLRRPALRWDDFEIITQSYSWEITKRNLWRPANEHTMPLGRVSTWLLIVAAGRPTNLPLVATLHGPVAVLLGMILVYLFVRRELGEPVYGLIAMGLFGITAHYDEAVLWFAASFTILALDTVLLALLAAQRWRQTGSGWALAWSAVWCALAPCWFASGVLAGPLCALYLLPLFGRSPRASEDVTLPFGSGPSNGDAITAHPHLDVPARAAVEPLAGASGWAGVRTVLSSSLLGKYLLALVPVLGTALFLWISLQRNWEHINHLEHYEMQNLSAVEAFDLGEGIKFTLRALVDNLLLGFFGANGINCPHLVIFGVLSILIPLVLAWWYWSPSPRLVALGLALILVSYVLIYSARSAWGYELVSRWTRYHLFPHLGLVLVLCAGLPHFRHWLVPDGDEAEVSSRVWTGWTVVLGVFLVLLLCQLPRGWSAGYADAYPRQPADLAYVEQMDNFCRANRISAATAQKVLRDMYPYYRIDGASDNAKDPWLFLRGSADPVPLSDKQARELLTPPKE